jgi:cell division transport system permease protein
MFRKRRKPRARPAPAPRPSAPAPKPARARSESRLHIYFTHHLRVMITTLGQMWSAPVSTLMTSAVIGIALAMPAGLYVLLGNLKQLASGWEGAAQISVFLKKSVSEDRVRALSERLRGWEGIDELRYISPGQALNEFRESSGFGEVLDRLDENPLPGVLVIRPSPGNTEAVQLEVLLGRLQQLNEVDMAQLDLEWVRRLNGLIEVGQRGVLLLGGLLGLAIILVVGNTIRLTIFNRREEILVTKLIGATDSFIRRPFLYGGFWYGVIGALIAWLLVSLFIGLLNGPVSRLAVLYSSDFSLDSLGLNATILLLTVGILLGYLGSWLAVGRHLKAIEPT